MKSAQTTLELREEWKSVEGERESTMHQGGGKHTDAANQIRIKKERLDGEAFSPFLIIPKVQSLLENDDSPNSSSNRSKTMNCEELQRAEF